MKRWERWTFNLCSLAVAASGFVYFWMKYLLVSDDPFAVVNHPWEAATLHLHVLASPPFILIFGVLFSSHIVKKLRTFRTPNRRTGLASFATFGVMIATGYLLQVATADAWLRALVILHVASGVVFTLTYGIHLAVSLKLVRRPSTAAIQEVA